MACDCQSPSCACLLGDTSCVSFSGTGGVGDPFLADLNFNTSGGPNASGLECLAGFGLNLQRVRVGTQAQRISATPVTPGDVWVETTSGFVFIFYSGAWTRAGHLDAWGTYTPRIFVQLTEWLALNNGTRQGHFWAFGRLVMFYADFVWGTTSSFGALVGGINMQLPFAPDPLRYIVDDPIAGSGLAYDVSAGAAGIRRRHLGYTTTAGLHFAYQITEAGGTVIQPSTFAWATGDRFRLSGFYYAAAPVTG